MVEWWRTSAVREERERLPWRQASDPWAVLVSEVMLAQTQALRVGAKWVEFVARYPSPSELARSPLAGVLELWAGLGYPRRALSLQQTARRLVEEHGGMVPRSLGVLKALPGIGEYTARAVLAFAFDEAVMPVDTNIARVIARAVAGEPVSRTRAQALAGELVSPASGGSERARAVMDLGAVLCRASSPVCEVCPLAARPGEQSLCRWRRTVSAGDPARGTWGVSGRQARFEGSDRQGRGRLLRAAGGDGLPAPDVAAAAGWPEDTDRAARVVGTLVADGLLVRAADGYRLPS